MPLTLYIEILTLSPAVLALVVVGVGLVKYARLPVVIGLAALGALVPAVALPYLGPGLGGGELLLPNPLFGGLTVDNALFSAAYRIDAFCVIAGYGLVLLMLTILFLRGFYCDLA